MEKLIRKLYKGCIELRDYDVQECIQKNLNMKVRYGGEIMTLSPADLSNRMVRKSPTVFKSKILGGKDYKLCAYEWEPDETDF